VPSRWWVPIPDVDPERVTVNFVHAAVSGWFDKSSAQHAAGEKPYALSPLADGDDGAPGLEVAVFTSDAEQLLAQATAPGSGIRLGNQIRRMGQPHLIARRTWGELAAGPHEQRWELTFATPVTFRKGDRATPLPEVRTILAGLHRGWQTWSDVTLPPLRLAVENTYASDLDLTSSPLRLTIPGRGSGPVKITIPGSTGRLTLRCASREAAVVASPLIRFASYAGVGSMTRRGLGVTRVQTPTS
jgi:CRISPR-associated endoribonuclease Cas6